MLNFFLFFLGILLLILLLIYIYIKPYYNVLEKGNFHVFNTDICMDAPTCFGQNPDSPYARLIFGDPRGTFTLNKNQAIVIEGISPPPCRYFGFTLYLFREGSFIPFASLGDTINNLDIPFNFQFKILVSPSPTITSEIQPNGLVLQVPKCAMHKGDLLMIVMRTAYFANNNLGMNYLMEMPIRAVKIQRYPPVSKLYDRKPLYVRATTPDEHIYENEFDRYLAGPLPGTVIQRIPSKPFLYDYNYDSGYTCIDDHIECLGDNRDATYLLSEPVFLGPNQALIVKGVNHVNTGKAIYFSQSLYDEQKQLGLESFSDEQSGDFNRFYTFAFTRVPIPNFPYPQYIIPPDVQEVRLAERAYVQPGSHVGPAPESLLWPVVFQVQL